MSKQQDREDREDIKAAREALKDEYRISWEDLVAKLKWDKIHWEEELRKCQTQKSYPKLS